MNRLVIATIGFIAGSGVGFAAGYYICNRKHEANKEYIEPEIVEKEEPKPEKSQSGKMEEMVQKTTGEGSLYSEIFGESKPAKIAKPGENGINYSQLCKDLQYKQETQSPPEDEPEEEGSEDISEEEIDMSKYEETYEERLERENEAALAHAEEYRKAHKGKIELMTSDEWDTDFPETDYEREDLYYFVDSDVLTDEDGNHLDELEFVGPKVRQVGWMQSSDEYIFVRNHPKEKEYRVCKENCAVEDWF